VTSTKLPELVRLSRLAVIAWSYPLDRTEASPRFHEERFAVFAKNGATKNAFTPFSNCKGSSIAVLFSCEGPHMRVAFPPGPVQ
jgi:hypothetical protein